MTTTIIPGGKLPLIPSPWGDGTRVHPHLLPLQFGDGKNSALISFYHLPDLVLLVKFDSALPLDLPDSERFKNYDGIRSLRDLTDQIKDCAEQNIKARRRWDYILAGGCCWSLA